MEREEALKIVRIGDRVRVSEPAGLQSNKKGERGGGKTHYGRIEDIVCDMFDGSDLYLVNVLGEIKTYKAESLLPLRKVVLPEEG